MFIIIVFVGLYGVGVYACSYASVHLLVELFQTLIFTIIVMPLTGLQMNADQFCLFWMDLALISIIVHGFASLIITASFHAHNHTTLHTTIHLHTTIQPYNILTKPYIYIPVHVHTSYSHTFTYTFIQHTYNDSMIIKNPFTMLQWSFEKKKKGLLHRWLF